MNDLILQLHAEGETVATPVAAPATEPSTTQATEPATTSVGNAKSEPITRNGEKATFGLKIDKLTGRRSVVMIHDNDAEPISEPSAKQAEPNATEPAAVQAGGENTVTSQQTVSQSATTPVQQQTDNAGQALFGSNDATAPAPYRDTAELLAAIQNNTVDERRIPMEQAFAYATYKQQMQQQAAQQAAQDAQQQQAPTNAADARQHFFERVEEVARQATLKDLNLTEEQLATAEYTDDMDLQARAKQFDTSLAWNRNAIMAQVQAAQQQALNARNAVQQIYNDINAKVAEYAKTEPEWKGINSLMSTYFWKMPHEEAVKYAAAINAYHSGNITEAQAQDLQEYYNKTRVAYYAKKNNLGTVNNPVPSVPKVEKPGNGNNKLPDNVVTKEQLRNASDYRQRRALIGQILSRSTNK